VKACAINCRNWRTSAESYMMLCRELVIASHYVVDAHTYPHLVKGQPWARHHLPWEISQARWLVANQGRIGLVDAVIYKDIYKAFVLDARMMYPQAVAVARRLEWGVEMTDEESLTLARVIASAVKSYWMTVTAHFWPKV
jgi:hypothetical protein